MTQKQKTAIIIGAGPAGLTAAYELVTKTDIKPIVLEMSDDIGGISKTVHYKGNRIDIGGHRFFSKSDTIMEWWQNILPIEEVHSNEKNKMLVRSRLSRIYFLRKFFDYPITLSKQTMQNLGFTRMMQMGISYLKTKLFPIRDEKSLEDFFINRFGKQLYNTFFKDYTEKVWGVSCSKIKPEWGAQRIKGISVTKVIKHAVLDFLGKKENDISQKDTETSLINRFLYPKYGPGQMWEEVARIVQEKGGEIRMHCKTVEVHQNRQTGNIKKVVCEDTNTHCRKTLHADYFFSTMPIKDLCEAWRGKMPENIKNIGKKLQYRDFITVGLLVKKLAIKNTDGKKVNDNWIYIQEPEVKVGRLQIFNNWSPYMVKDPKTTWLGLEYFCNEGDALWEKSEEDLKELGAKELETIGIIEQKNVLDAVVIKTPKAYPAYFGSYEKIDAVKEYVNDISNLFLIGRNGMHRYNNQDHSMLTAIRAVRNIRFGLFGKENIWNINTENEYHEEKVPEESSEPALEPKGKPAAEPA
jgi:protoporphyrinogen oxidase